MIDLHCHLLPGVDDGPADVAGSVALAHALVAAEVTTVAATPHVSVDVPTTAERIEAETAALRGVFAAEAIPLTVVPGAEVDLVTATSLDDERLARLRLGSGPWLLLEMPLRPVAGVEPIVRAIMARGHRVLLAHPERSPACQREPALVDRLVAAGALAQLTAGSFEGRFGRIVQRFSQRLADLELVHVVASDAHDVARRGPGLRAALEAAGLEGRLEWLTGEVPAAILEGGAIPRRPSPGLRPRRWRLPVRRRAPDVS